MSNGHQKTIVLGFDGMDARLTSVLMSAGLLPSFSAMAAIGGFHQIISTTPAESAVAWTCFNTGANPAQTNIFDFIGREPGSYMPRLSGYSTTREQVPPDISTRWGIAAVTGAVAGSAGYRASKLLSRRAMLQGTLAISAATAVTTGVGIPWARWWPQARTVYSTGVSGQPWWDRVAQRGQRSVVLRIPMTFPARAHENVRLLAGLGTPDLRGTNGTYTLLTDTDFPVDRKNTRRLVWNNNRCNVQLPGPPAPSDPANRLAAQFTVERIDSSTLRVSDANGKEQQVKKGQWSSWIALRYRSSALYDIRGSIRIYFRPGEGIQLYVTPVEMDSGHANGDFPIASPSGFAADLHRDCGQFRTVGWESQTWGLVDGVLDKDGYLSDAHAAIDMNIKQLESQLARNDWDNLMLVVQATDQVQHMFFDDSLVRMRAGNEVDRTHHLIDLYRKMDQIAGRVSAVAEQQGWRLVILSDHGFAPYRRAINLNTWLAKKGWLALKDRDQWDEYSVDHVLAGDPWSNVDWFNTRAYALGLSGIFLNVAGREPAGIVKRNGEYEFLQERLKHELSMWADPELGKPILQNVHLRQDVYDGPFLDNAPDLIVGLAEGYRISPVSSVGGIPMNSIVDNSSQWNGDHCGINAETIPGICFTNFKSDWPKMIAIGSLSKAIWPF